MSNHWKQVTANHPCRICGATHWCAAFEDGTAACRRVDAGGIHKTDSSGLDYWLYLAGNSYRRNEVELPAATGAPIASPETLDIVYRALLDQVGLTPVHRNALQKRGLPKDEITRRVYRSLGDTHALIAEEMVKQFGSDTCARVPGLYVKEERFWSLSSASGILIPNRSLDGRIRSLLTRLDDPKEYGKYLHVSSNRHGGPRPKVGVHVPLFDGDRSIVRVTEGVLKADVATVLSGMLTLGLPGVSTWREAVEILKELAVERVRLAFDADAAHNRHVARALQSTFTALKDAGLRVDLEQWEEADGKGIDDLLLAGKQPGILSGITAEIFINGLVLNAEEVEKAKRAAGDPLEAAKEQLAEILSAAKDDPGAPFNAANREVLGLIRNRDAGEWQRVKVALKKCGVSIRDLERELPAREHRGPGGAVATAEGQKNEDKRPRIDAGDLCLERVSARALDAILDSNDPPHTFRRTGVPVRIETDEHGHPVIREVTHTRMRWLLARCANWGTWHEEKGFVPDLPPKHVVEDVLATPDLPFPILTRIVRAPVFAGDGTLETEPGYHPASHTYYQPAPGFVVPPIPEHPTPEQIAEALSLFRDDMLVDFPFTSEAEFSHALCVALLPFVRAMIDGPTPIMAIEKPSPGTGASLLVDALTFPSLGHDPPSMTEGKDDDEWRKRITAKLLDGGDYILIDNVNRKLDSSALASVVTRDIWEDRVLGGSSIARAPVRCGWLLTANNPKYSTEIARRIIRIRMDAKIDQPFLRKEFKHQDLRTWVRENRGRLVAAALTFGRAWIDAGRPCFTEERLGMFESWSRIMGGILQVAGAKGFLKNIREVYRDSDEEGQIVRAFLTAWWEAHQGREISVADLWTVAQSLETPLDLGDGSDRSQKIRLGRFVGKLRDRTFLLTPDDGESLDIQVVNTGTAQRAQKYRLMVRSDSSSQVNVVNVSECGEDTPTHAGDEELEDVSSEEVLNLFHGHVGLEGDPSHSLTFTTLPEPVESPAPAVDAPDPDLVWDRARSLGFPSVLIGGLPLKTGEQIWTGFCRKANPEQLREALEGLRRLEYED